MHIARRLSEAQTPTALALGNFDGLHRGHQAVLAPILGQTQACKTVLTFDPHPRQVLGGTLPPLLTPLDEKLSILESLGLEQVILLPFTRELANYSPTQFCDHIIQTGLAAQALSVGANFCYGHQRQGTIATLQAWAEAAAITLHTAAPLLWQGERISSSRIRAVIQAGQVDLAATLLGRPYCLQGTVVTGQQQGRQLGFPTANVAPPPEKLLPLDGVYVAQVAEQAAVLNIGVRPTLAVQGGKTQTRTVEVHILDWAGDLYGQILTVSLLKRLRGEARFPSLAALQAQIAADCEAARQWFAQTAA